MFISYLKRLISPRNLLLPILLFAILYNVASYDVRQKKREKELDKDSATRGTPHVKTIGKPKLGGSFTLVDTDGKVVTDSEFRGKYLMVYFGFTNCPDICPTEMKKMTKALNDLERENPKVAEKILPIFISCDPPRDSCTEIKDYLEDYHPKFVGLTGTPEQIKRACKKYRVFYSAPDYEEGKSDYLVDHSIFIYFMDPYGNLCEYFAQNTTADKVKERMLDVVGK
jgi:protein SCO1/2